jgi:hypothetical protein
VLLELLAAAGSSPLRRGSCRSAPASLRAGATGCRPRARAGPGVSRRAGGRSPGASWRAPRAPPWRRPDP